MLAAVCLRRKQVDRVSLNEQKGDQSVDYIIRMQIGDELIQSSSDFPPSADGGGAKGGNQTTSAQIKPNLNLVVTMATNVTKPLKTSV